MVQRAENKLSKRFARYRNAPKGSPARCRTCIHFNPGDTRKTLGTCDIVAGPIFSDDLCDFWENASPEQRIRLR